jgi:hypothetical protein
MANKTIQINGDRLNFFAGYLSAFKNNAEIEKAIATLKKEYSANAVELFMASTDIETIKAEIKNPKHHHLSKEGRKAKVRNSEDIEPTQEFTNDVEPN